MCCIISALLLLYDVTNKTSFDNIRAWLGEIREYAQDDVVIMLLGMSWFLLFLCVYVRFFFRIPSVMIMAMVYVLMYMYIR